MSIFVGAVQDLLSTFPRKIVFEDENDLKPIFHCNAKPLTLGPWV